VAQYSALCGQRDVVLDALKNEKIPSAIYYPKPLHVQAHMLILDTPLKISLFHKGPPEAFFPYPCTRILPSRTRNGSPKVITKALQ
jgi:hypothetical protein